MPPVAPERIAAPGDHHHGSYPPVVGQLALRQHGVAVIQAHPEGQIGDPQSPYRQRGTGLIHRLGQHEDAVIGPYPLRHCGRQADLHLEPRHGQRLTGGPRRRLRPGDPLGEGGAQGIARWQHGDQPLPVVCRFGIAPPLVGSHAQQPQGGGLAGVGGQGFVGQRLGLGIQLAPGGEETGLGQLPEDLRAPAITRDDLLEGSHGIPVATQAGIGAC